MEARSYLRMFFKIEAQLDSFVNYHKQSGVAIAKLYKKEVYLF